MTASQTTEADVAELMTDKNTPWLRFYRIALLERPWLTIIALLAVIGFMAMQSVNLKVDASADSLVLEGDEDLEFFREVGKRYASEEYLVIAYQPNESLLSDSTLATLGQLVDDLQAVDGVSSILSILDVPLLYSPKLSITDLSAEIGTMRSGRIDRKLASVEFRESPIYRQLIASVDGKTTAVQVNLRRDTEYVRLLERRNALRDEAATGSLSLADRDALLLAEQDFKHYATQAAERQRALVSNVRAILDTYRLQSNTLYLGGVPMIAADMVAFVQSDLRYFGVGILIFIIGLLTVIFRSVKWVMLPLLACVATNVFMLGLLGMLDWRMTVISSNFVALLLIITLAIAVHLVVRYRELERLHPAASTKDLALETVRLMIRPCLYTGLTTIVAFMSLVISGIRPVIDFGWMMTTGVSIALLFTFIVVPVGMVVAGRTTQSRPSGQSEESGVLTLRFARATEHFGGWVLGVALALFALSVWGISRLEVENRFIDYFDESTEIYRGMELIDSELGGTIPLDIMLQPRDDDTGIESGGEDAFDEFDEFDDFEEESVAGEASQPPGYWFTVAGLTEIERIHDHVDSLEESGKVLSLATVYKVARDLLGHRIDDIQLTLAYQKLPPSIKQALIDPYMSVEADEARIAVRIKETSHTLRRADLLASLDTFMRDELQWPEDRYRFTGMLVLYNNMLQSLFSSQILTLGVVFVAITAMLVILFRSMYLAMIGIVPNVLAALLVLGGMGLAGIPLDMMTITIAAISIGIGVDNTIHYIHRFKREFVSDRNYLATMYRCHGSIGRAMYYTSITIIFGFSILTFSNFKPSIYFGLLTGVAMLSALLGSLMLLPRLLLLLKPLGAER